MKSRGFTPDFKRSKAVFHINALVIIEMNILINHLLNLFPGDSLASVQAFGLECSKEVFH